MMRDDEECKARRGKHTASVGILASWKVLRGLDDGQLAEMVRNATSSEECSATAEVDERIADGKSEQMHTGRREKKRRVGKKVRRRKRLEAWV